MISASDFPPVQRTASMVTCGSSLLEQTDSQFCLRALFANCNLFAFSLLLTQGVSVASFDLFPNFAVPVMGHKPHRLTSSGKKVSLHGIRKLASTWFFAAGQTSDVPAAFHKCDVRKQGLLCGDTFTRMTCNC